jgi:hypothetical protein
MFTDVQLPVRQGWGWGRGEACIPPAAPTPLTLPYTLLYICTVHELCSRTVGEYRLRARILKHLLEAEKSTFHEELSFQRSQSTTGLKQGGVSV